jgi:endonuclease G
MQIGRATQVIVPAKCWKVILVLDGGLGDDLQKVNANTRLIAVIMPNDMSVGEEWAGYRVSVRAVEQLTGYTFFDQVPAAVIAPLKTVVDGERIPRPVALRH